MEMEILDKIQLIHSNRGLFEDSSEGIDLYAVIENLKKDHSWEEGELNAKTLVKDPKINVVLVKMQKGTEIISMQKNQSVTFCILQGKLKLYIRKGSQTLYEGESLILYEKTKYSIVSIEATALLITLAS